MKMTHKNNEFWLDLTQGKTINEKDFGFIGLRDDNDDYCGIFFTWPNPFGTNTERDRGKIKDSWEYDETSSAPKIDSDRALAFLDDILDKVLPDDEL